MDQSTVGLETIFDVNSFETLEETLVSYVAKARYCDGSQPNSWIAIKTASTLAHFSKQPHDIKKELRILRNLSPHVNIIELLGHTFDSSTTSIHFWMPYIDRSLRNLLDSSRFSPYPPSTSTGTTGAVSHIPSFRATARSLIYQLICGVAYLHDHRIAHRDLKPANVLLSKEGCVKIIDFGIAWTDPSSPGAEEDLWPEPPGQMCFDVASGPYRAPELLFGATNYDAFATDLWSLGALLAEFFTPLRLTRTDGEYDEGEVDSAEGDATKRPFVIPRSLSVNDPDIDWRREPLFDSSGGQIGLVWSIFKVRGTPNKETWPTFQGLPDAQKVVFATAIPVKLYTLLPNLPVKSSNKDQEPSLDAECLDLVEKLLVYPPTTRLRASIALQHSWFAKESVLVPGGYSDQNGIRTIDSWDGKTLGDLLATLYFII